MLDWRERDHEVIPVLTELTEAKPGLGFWKLHDRLRRAGHRWIHKRAYRIYRELGLNAQTLVQETGTHTQSTTIVCPAISEPALITDFMSDALYRGSRFRTFNVLEDFNREVLAIEIDPPLTSGRLVRVFEQLAEQRPLPAVLRTESSPEFLRAAFTGWCACPGIFIDYIEPGKPNQNADIERFNHSTRPRC